MNYTQPDNPNHEDDPKEWLRSALVFAKALGKTLEPNTGVVIELENDMLELYEDKKVIVSNVDNQIVVSPYVGGYNDGEFIRYFNPEDNLN